MLLNSKKGREPLTTLVMHNFCLHSATRKALKPQPLPANSIKQGQ
jgi:hypothetical protein